MTKYYWFGMNMHGNRLNLKRKYSSAYEYKCNEHKLEPIIEIGDNCYTWDLVICAIRNTKPKAFNVEDISGCDNNDGRIQQQATSSDSEA